ncbi:MAG: hypothetical protein A3H98_03215 [Bacteroidetes bacterium RIFCSPLOWO2_02_FULL_36_8]|nr:MAG: hypothetical protein A3H98_03215 [Bacteroidetes bacterium RIFCSPLOWO2_02_FULL_36_8]OFY70363.1 MAG: hypothetical protein A3G23_09545 [Bacteroidetes bacterium RIFCSPLOWO2_12_FULL_37_12]
MPFLLLTCIYSILLIWLAVKWSSIPTSNQNGDILNSSSPKNNDSPLVTIIIPARNEAGNLPKLLSSLENQTYQKSKIEIIIVDDHSNDNSTEIITEFKKKLPNLALIRLSELSKNSERDKDNLITGKKSAINVGVTQAKGDWILLTDADCKVADNWVSVMINCMVSEELNMVTGPVKGEEKKPFLRMACQEIIHLEFLGFVGMGAGGLKGGIPLMCNGANIGFRKSAFYQCGGFGNKQNLASGDDEFLLRNMHKMDPGKVKFIKDKTAIVTTVLSDSFLGFLKQRIRWASKAFSGKTPLSLLFIIFISVFYCLTGWQWFMVLSGMAELKLFLILFLVKLFAEFVFLYPILDWFDKRKLILWLIPVQFIYPFYIIVVGLASRFRFYRWKDRWVT